MRNLFIITLAISSVVLINCAFAQQGGFINIEGGNLTAKLVTAHQQGHSRAASTPSHSYWIAYGFPVRPNVAVDVVIKGAEGESEFGGVMTGNVGAYETRNLGIFLLYSEAGGATPVRAEVYNLDRQRDYEGIPVYWLGRASAAESFPLLRNLINQTADNQVEENLTQAIALHNDPQAENILEELARKGRTESARVRAILWLGRLGGHVPLLSAVARDTNESLSVRQAAIRAIGKGPDTQAVATLRELYASMNDQVIKEEIIDSAAKSRERGAAVEFLTQVAQSDENSELSRHAQSRLDKVTGEKQRRKIDKQLDKSVKSKNP
jgi:HEAT repeat protein